MANICKRCLSLTQRISGNLLSAYRTFLGIRWDTLVSYTKIYIIEINDRKMRVSKAISVEWS